MASSMKRAQTFSSPQDGTRPRVPMRNQTMRLVRLCYISECQILKRFYWGSHIRMSHLAKGLQTLGWVTLMCDHPIEGNNCRKMNLLRSKMSENDTKKVQKCQNSPEAILQRRTLWVNRRPLLSSKSASLAALVLNLL